MYYLIIIYIYKLDIGTYIQMFFMFNQYKSFVTFTNLSFDIQVYVFYTSIKVQRSEIINE